MVFFFRRSREESHNADRIAANAESLSVVVHMHRHYSALDLFGKILALSSRVEAKSKLKFKGAFSTPPISPPRKLTLYCGGNHLLWSGFSRLEISCSLWRGGTFRGRHQFTGSIHSLSRHRVSMNRAFCASGPLSSAHLRKLSEFVESSTEQISPSSPPSMTSHSARALQSARPSHSHERRT